MGVLLSFAFVTFFARPKKVTKEKTPKSNARDGCPRACHRFQPFYISALSVAEIGTRAITLSPRGRDFGFRLVQNIHLDSSDKKYRIAMDKLNNISFQDLFDMVRQVFDIIFYYELKRHRFVVADEAIIAQSCLGN